MTEATTLRDEALGAISRASTETELESIEIEYLGRRDGKISRRLMSGIESLPPDERKRLGQEANEAKQSILEALRTRRAEHEAARLADLGETEAIDVTFPAPPLHRGHAHVLSQVRRELEVIFERIGYTVEEGPEIETDWYNFEALNLPKGHASRDVQDTFFLDANEEVVLRTHTSPVQIRGMQRLGSPPIYIVAPGRVYRRDNLDATHLPYFMQLEGLAVDEGLTVGDLKGTLHYMVQSLFGADRQVRMRPHHFGYTEPSYEFDTLCGRCKGKGCRSCGGEGWLETGGCGMVHPNVLRNGGIDPSRYSGYAWGFGIERMALLKYDVEDLRLFYENDLRFNRQF
ncbi:MAG TPA: phenylalanine--tRNA ligase subunit alpha [Candidatus Dormibacteraeota bacterium]|nr:phenylalanine--tRNA ligase subunit alpha [Candidatus Dormibacteraeota bacterium]